MVTPVRRTAEVCAMTPLRQKMLEDMRLRDLAAKTQEAYVGAVQSLPEIPVPVIPIAWAGGGRSWRATRAVAC